MKMVNNAISIGSVFRIPIRLHISLPIAAGLFALLSGAHLLAVLILVVGVFGSVALHELGHSLVARAKGGYIHEIVLYPFGGAAKISNLSQRPSDEILIALAGPAVSLILALLFRQWALTQFLGDVNTMLFFFNILPVFPMDGGRVLRAGLTIKQGRITATRNAATVGKYFCGAFILIGLFGLPVVLFGVIGPLHPNLMLAFIGFYIYRAGQSEYRHVMREQQSSGYHENSLDVEVSPPPYAAGNHQGNGLSNWLQKLFHR